MIDEKLQQELRHRFNPDGSLLRQHQLRMLEMLKYIDGICKKHDIKYWLSSGTLLGAVRHGGFIPWDDDLDIEMLKCDYDRLIDILKKERSSLYVIQTYETDKKYCLPFAKLRDLHSCVIESITFDYKYNGCWIDIFPIEKNTRFCLKVSAFLWHHFFSLVGVVRRRPKHFLFFYKKMFYRWIYPLLRLVNKTLPLRYLYHTYGVPFLKPRVMNDIYPLKEILFENDEFPVPFNTDAYLRRIYGEYMSVPPLENIKSHNLKIKIDRL